MLVSVGLGRQHGGWEEWAAGGRPSALPPQRAGCMHVDRCAAVRSAASNRASLAPAAPQVTGASWLAFGVADLYYARTGVARYGGASAAINFSLGAFLLYKVGSWCWLLGCWVRFGWCAAPRWPHVPALVLGASWMNNQRKPAAAAAVQGFQPAAEDEKKA